MTAPLAIDLFAGLGGWTEGLIAEGFFVIGFDIERHQYGEHRYPGHLVIQDVLTLHGTQFKGAALIVASPPCQAYSYRAMPWSRAKALPPPDNALFEACFRIQREACEAAGRHIPLIVENVSGAQPWVGRARWNFGSFYLWGDVPALMPPVNKQGVKVPGVDWHNFGMPGYQHPSFRDMALADGVKQGGSGAAWWRDALNERCKEGTAIKNGGLTTGPLVEGYKGVGGRSSIRNRSADARPSHGNSTSRKAASAMIAKIPLALSRYTAATFR